MSEHTVRKVGGADPAISPTPLASMAIIFTEAHNRKIINPSRRIEADMCYSVMKIKTFPKHTPHIYPSKLGWRLNSNYLTLKLYHQG